MNRVVMGVCGAALAAALVLATGGLAPALAYGRDYVLVVDCSGTMRYEGRDAATVAEIRSLVEGMGPEDRVSVYGYGEGASAILPTYPMVVGDDAKKQAVLKAISFVFDDDRTDITAGLDLAWRERDRVLPTADARRAGRRGCVILLTDGKLIPVYADYSQYSAIYEASRRRLLELGGLFGAAGIPIHTIGLGKSDAVDGELLTQVSTASGATFHHAPSAKVLGGSFDAIAERLGAADRARADGTTADAAAATTPAAGKAGSEAVAAREEPSAGDGSGLPNTLQRAIAAAGRRTAYPAVAYQASTAALGVLMGVVAIGMRRRQTWTNVFTRSLGHEPHRVKGYLRPVAPEGVTLARACVPLENPGSESVTLGAGGEFLSELTDTTVEIEGAPGGTPPFVKVIKGTITVDGEVVADTRKLADGNIIEIEGRTYVYLRGSRR